MKTRRYKTMRKKPFFFILTVFFAISFLLCAILVWFAPESWPGGYIRDQWLIHEVEQHQRADGFFDFSNDEHPQLIAETYFAVMTLNGLSTNIPNSDQLSVSLTRLEEDAKSAMLNKKSTLGPRDIYELLMIHHLTSVPFNNKFLSGYLSQMSDLLIKQNELQFSISVHNWYYALQALIISNRITPQLIKKTEGTILIHLATKPVQLPQLIETALLIDLSTSLHMHLNITAEQNADLILKRSWNTKGGFQIGQTPDIFSTYFAVILAHEIGSEDLIQRDAIEHWLATQRNWIGYSTNVTNPLVTAYATVLRTFLDGVSINGAPR